VKHLLPKRDLQDQEQIHSGVNDYWPLCESCRRGATCLKIPRSHCEEWMPALSCELGPHITSTHPQKED